MGCAMRTAEEWARLWETASPDSLEAMIEQIQTNAMNEVHNIVKTYLHRNYNDHVVCVCYEILKRMKEVTNHEIT